MKAKRERIRCYIEGVEIPVIGASVQIGVDAPAVATVEVVPTDEVLRLLPRSLVVITFWDDRYHEAVEARERVLYSGETVGVSFSSQVTSRSAVIRVVDESANWDTCYHFLYDIMGNSGAAFLGGSTQVFDRYFRGHNAVTKSLVADGLRRGPRTPGLDGEGLLGGILRLLEGVGGVRGKSVGTNDFFTYNELRLKILQRIGSDSGKTAFNLFSHTLFEKWISNTISGLGQLVTIRDLLNNLNRYILYNIVPNPAPLYIPETSRDKTRAIHLPLGPSRSALKLTKKVAQNMMKVLGEVKDLHGRQNTVGAMAHLSKYTTSDSESDAGWFSLKATKKMVMEAVDAAKLDTAHSRIKALVEEFKSTINQHDIFMRKYFSTASSSSTRATVENGIREFEPRIKALRRIYYEARSYVGSKTYKETVQSKLITQIFRPDIWFAAPPRCNVLFPNQYATLAFARNYMREVSRLQITSHDELLGPGMFLNSQYFAPYIEKYLDDQPGGPKRRSIRHPMVHEYFTGIIPKLERMSSANIFAERKYYQRNQKVRPQSGKRLGYADKIAHYMFYQNRYAPRTLQITGDFNPRPVVGFPMVVVKDGWAASADILRDDGDGRVGGLITTDSDKPPVQFIGVLRQLSHTISNPQESALTSYGLTHVRYHDGSDDPHLADSLDFKTKGPVRTFTKVYHLRAEDFLDREGDNIRLKRNERALQWLLKMTPQGQDSTALDDKNRPEGKYSVALGDKAWNGGEIVDFRVNSNGALFNRGNLFVTQTILGIAISSAEARKNFPFNTFNIYESVSFKIRLKVRAEDLHVPFEEALRPGWFDDVYSNKKIGPEFYMPNIGCGSIVDETDNAEWGLAPGTVIRVTDRNYTVVRSTDAINTLAFMYQSAKNDGIVDDFVDGITHREIATVEDVLLGDGFGLEISDLMGTSDPFQMTTKDTVLLNNEVTEQLKTMSDVDLNHRTRGTPGFLTWSVMPLKNLVGMANPELEYPRIHERGRVTERSKISKDIDVRVERRQAVEAYRASIDKLLLTKDTE
jgi:hypothetical protein